MPARFWTEKRLWELTEMLDAGLSDPVIARRLGRSVNGIQVARKRNGIPSRQARFYSANEIAALFGVACNKTVSRWLSSGAMRGRKQRVRAGRLHWHVTYEQVTAFVANPAHWCKWEPGKIADDDLREWAMELRGGEVFLTPGEVAARYCVCHGAVNNWIRTGALQAYRHGNWWVREADLAGFVPPHRRDRHGTRAWRFDADEDATIVAMRTAGSTYERIATELGRPLGSVAGRWKRLEAAL